MKDLECSECSLEYRHGENCPNGVADQGVRRMKSAEEVAEEISDWLPGICVHLPRGRCLECQNQGLAQALSAFAEERVIARAGRCKWHIGLQLFCSTCCKECETKARAEALEEAAKVAEESDDRELAGNKIRALKGRTV